MVHLIQTHIYALSPEAYNFFHQDHLGGRFHLHPSKPSKVEAHTQGSKVLSTNTINENDVDYKILYEG